MNFIKKITLILAISSIAFLQQSTVFAPKASAAKKFILYLTMIILPLGVGDSSHVLSPSVDSLLPRIPDEKMIKQNCNRYDFDLSAKVISAEELVEKKFLAIPFLAISRDNEFESFAINKIDKFGLSSLLPENGPKTYKIINMCPKGTSNHKIDYLGSGIFSYDKTIFSDRENFLLPLNMYGLFHEFGHVILGDTNIKVEKYDFELRRFQEDELSALIKDFRFSTIKNINDIKKALQQPNLSKELSSLLKARLYLLAACLENSENCLSVEDKTKEVFLHPRVFFRNNETCFGQDKNEVVSFYHHTEFLADATGVIFSNHVTAQGLSGIPSYSHPEAKDRLTFMKEVQEFMQASAKKASTAKRTKTKKPHAAHKS